MAVNEGSQAYQCSAKVGWEGWVANIKRSIYNFKAISTVLDGTITSILLPL